MPLRVNENYCIDLGLRSRHGKKLEKFKLNYIFASFTTFGAPHEPCLPLGSLTLTAACMGAIRVKFLEALDDSNNNDNDNVHVYE